MNKKIFTKTLNKAFNDSIPNNFEDKILKDLNIKNTKEVNLKSNNRNFFNKPLIFATALILIFGIIGYTTYDFNYKLSSTVEIDVNPSIEIRVNKKDKVLKVIAHNKEAKDVIGNMDFKNTNIDVAMNAIVGSMVTKGYINNIANSILISVESRDSSKGEILRQRLTENIETIIGTDAIDGSILSQNITEKNSEVEEIAKKYNISTGKAALIIELTTNNKKLKIEDLVKLSINELNLVGENKNNNLGKVNKVGSASSKSYIDKSEAEEIAFKHAKVNVKDIMELEVEFDADDGNIIYEVDFETKDYEYEYEIDAKTGEIIFNEKESKNNKNDEVVQNPGSNNFIISAKEAKQIALNHAKASNVINVKIEYDRKDNEYSVEFVYGGYEYEYEIDAKTGKIKDVEKEKQKESVTSNDNIISKEEAKQIALNHAGATNVTKLKIEYDQKDNEYSVEFVYNGYEYEYEIDAKTGKIKDVEKEKQKETVPSNNETISKDKAKQIALNHAGAKSVTKLKIEYDKKDNEYSVEFVYNGYKYEYEIDAKTGKIKDFEKEKQKEPVTSNDNIISKEEAKQIALNHAGATNVTKLKVEYDKKDNEYSVEFVYNGYEYEYEIDAKTGKIKDFEKERN